MQINKILQQIDLVLSKDWTFEPIESKIALIKTLKECYPTMGRQGTRGWVVRIANLWQLPQKNIWRLLNEPIIDDALLVPKNPKVKPDIFPTAGWINDYFAYTMNSEAPKSFHFWTAISILGSVIGRNIYFKTGHRCVFPNHFIILISPSGKCKKTSAADIGVDLLYSIDTMNIIAEKVTPEALLDSMSSANVPTTNSTEIEPKKECRGFIYAPELPIFLGKQTYNEGMIDIITRLGDNPSKLVYKTRTKSIIKLTNINASMLGCVTPDGLSLSIPQSAFGGGFMSRFLFVLEKSTSRELALPPARDDEMRSQLLARLKSLHIRKGEFKMHHEAHAWYLNWYHKLRKEIDTIDDMRMSGYYARKPDHLLRLSMVLILAEEGELEFTIDIFNKALRIFDTLELPMPDAFVNPNEHYLGKNTERILSQLKEAKGAGISRTVLLKRNYRQLGNRVNLDKCLSTLLEVHLIESAMTGGTMYYYIKKEIV